MRRLCRLVLLALLAIALTPSVAAQSDAQQRVWCYGDTADPNLRIGGCTARIQSGTLSTENTAIAFSNRDNAYADKGQHDRAIADSRAGRMQHRQKLGEDHQPHLNQIKQPMGIPESQAIWNCCTIACLARRMSAIGSNKNRVRRCDLTPPPTPPSPAPARN